MLLLLTDWVMGARRGGIAYCACVYSLAMQRQCTVMPLSHKLNLDGHGGQTMYPLVDSHRDPTQVYWTAGQQTKSMQQWTHNQAAWARTTACRVVTMLFRVDYSSLKPSSIGDDAGSKVT